MTYTYFGFFERFQISVQAHEWHVGIYQKII